MKLLKLIMSNVFTPVIILFYAGNCFGDALTISGPESASNGTQYSVSGGTAPYSWCISKGDISQAGVVDNVSSLCGTAKITVIDSCGSTAVLGVRLPGGQYFRTYEQAGCSNCTADGGPQIC